MAQKSGNNVKPPTNGSGAGHNEDAGRNTMKEALAEQHHGETTKPVEEDRRIGQHNGTGRPPLMKK